MLRVKSSGDCVPGALVRLRIADAAVAEDVYCLVAPYHVLPSSALSSLCRVELYTPTGRYLKGIQRDWVRRVWNDASHGATLVQLTLPAVHWLRANGVTCRAVGAVSEVMRATHVTCGRGEDLPELNLEFARIVLLAEDNSLELCSQVANNGLLVGADEKLLAVSMKTSAENQPLYSMVQIVNDFLEDMMWQIRHHTFCFTSIN